MKKKRKVSVALVLDQHLGTPRETDDRLLGLDLTPASARALDRLNELGVRVVLIGPQKATDSDLRIIGRGFQGAFRRGRNVRESLEACRRELGGRKGIFVSADRVERGEAAEHGWRPAPHLLVAALWVAGETTCFVRARGNVELERLKDPVPYFLERGTNSWTFFGLLTRRAISQAVRLGVEVQLLAVDEATEDVLVTRIDVLDNETEKELARRRVVYSEPGRALISLGPGESVSDLKFRGCHGRYMLLTPRPELLEPVAKATHAEVALTHLPVDRIKLEPIKPVLDLANLLGSICIPSTSAFQADVDRYSGAAPLDASGVIISRHVKHPDNARVVDALVKDLRDIGYCTYKHAFSWEGVTLHNVIADLPGRGFWMIDPDIIERVRSIFLQYPLPDPPDWMPLIEKLLGRSWLEKYELLNLDPWTLRARIETILCLRPWWPWWLKRCLSVGLGTRIVMVGCHLDSSAGFEPGYEETTDPAPGADDNASGIAATLAVARYMWRFRGKLRHTVRFCFFNAEEVGREGSKTYAAMLKAYKAPVKAISCVDMIGYNSDDQSIFEIHAGYTDVAVRDLSVPIAEKIRDWAALQGQLGDGQIYRGTSPSGPSGASDRSLYDPAIGRSDHASFHAQGYPAVVVSEDFFANLPSEPAADPNPNYHRAADTIVDAAYGAAISCAIARAVKEMAE